MTTGDSLDRKIRIEKPVADDSFDGAGSGQWQLVATPWAQIHDILPSRATEKTFDDFNIAERPSRVRMRFRTDITPNMRFVCGERIMQIVAGPAEIGRREWVEFIVEDYSPAGNGA